MCLPSQTKKIVGNITEVHEEPCLDSASSPIVSVIVANWNGKELLAACLHSLYQQTFKDFEIIVVDNGSTDGSVELVRKQFSKARVIALEKNLGFCAANNLGIRQARGKYIALLNNDAELTPRWLEELVKALDANPGIGFCASKILLYDQPHLADTCGDYYSRDGLGGKRGHLQEKSLYNEQGEVFGACAGAAIYRRELLEELGGFDEDFFLAHEDTDLSFRVQLRGYRCLYVPTAIVYHRLSSTIGADSDTYIYYGHRNAEYVYIKNMPGSLLWRSLPSHLLLNLALFFFYLRRGKARPFVRAKLDALKALPRLLRKRRTIQRQRSVPVEYIASLLEESWLRQAARKKLKRWVHRVAKAGKEWGRRALPYKCKFLLKRIWVQSSAPQPRISLPSDSVEDTLCIWTEDAKLGQALARLANPDRRAPRASIIVLTHNKLPFTRLCIESIYYNTQYPHFELVVVDNDSTDGTRAYLEGLLHLVPNLQALFNERNEGFARANNQGVLRTRGDYVVLLNNDIIVGPGWLSRLIRYLEQEPTVGMVGPVTNSAGNEQMIPANYTGLEELENFAEQRLQAYKGRCFEIDMLGMFCVVIRRTLIDKVGLLDERFELGTFEDDDYSHRAGLCGYKLVCVEDVFVHHFGKATMGQLGDDVYLKIFERNRGRFEQKWGTKWRPRRLRTL